MEYLGWISASHQVLHQRNGEGRYLWCIPVAAILLAIGVSINKYLAGFDNSILEWSPWHIKQNFVMKPMLGRWWWLYTPVLCLLIPLLAFIEEYWFRYGTTNWVRGVLIGGLAFGIIHFTSFVSVRMVIWLTLMGLALVEVYFLGGLMACFMLHATYNLMAVGVTIVTEKFVPMYKSKTQPTTA